MKALKLVVVGDGAVGKTALLVRYTENVYSTDYVPTTWDNFAKNIQIDREMIGLQICDTPGQEDYERMRPLLYNDTNAFIICYAINSRNSFENVQSKWIGEIRHHCPDKPVIIVATKTDFRLHKDLKEPLLSPEEGEQLRQSVGATLFLECSSLEGEGVNEVFKQAALAVLKPPPRPKSNKINCNIL
ncbi:ras-related protein ced-10-like [Convolutriloba macropyga]|uniref:ras-related protein ced-10-like n=1 Tax=Convolutriloba macropyga TaxID=536237 RepID=UPI003F51CF17